MIENLQNVSLPPKQSSKYLSNTNEAMQVKPSEDVPSQRDIPKSVKIYKIPSNMPENTNILGNSRHALFFMSKSFINF